MSRLDDWKARAIIRGTPGASGPVASDPWLDVEHNMIVRAGAGSGKTTALVERVLAYLRLGEEPSSIVAITFTRKAAAELQGRIHAAVDHAVTSGGHEDDRLQLQRARRRLDEMHIGTIHGFSSQLLRQYADMAGVPPDFRQVEEEEEEDMRSRFWSAFLAGEDENDDLVRLREAGVSRASLLDLFGRLVENADLEPVQSGPIDIDFSRASEAARQIMDDLESISWVGNSPDAVQRGLRKARFMLEMREEMSLAQTAEWLRLFTGMVKKDQLSLTLNRWDRPQKFMKAVRDGTEHDEAPWHVLPRIREEIMPPLTAWDVDVHGRAIRLVSRAVSDYAAYRQAEGRLTISDPIHILNNLLRASPDVRRDVQTQYQRILVDEFQDTDPVQASVIFHMVASDRDDDDWARNRLLPGRLLLVGDDKQSIYRFRRADFEVFARCEEAIVSQGGRSLVLGTNFRSTAAVCHWINEAMEPLFPPSDLEGRREQAPWEPLRPRVPEENDAAPDDSAPGRDAAVGSLVLNPKLTAADGVAAEARTIARMIREQLDSGAYASPGDVMILLRRNKYVSRYVAEVAAAGLPVRVTGGRAVGGSDVLPAVCSILEAIVRQGDELAGVAALRTPFFAVSDADLMAWRRDEGRFDGLAEPAVDKSGEPQTVAPQSGEPQNVFVHSVVHARRVLNRIGNRFRTLPPWEALRATADEEGWWDMLAARETEAVDTGTLQKILALFASAEDRGLDWIEATSELLQYRSGNRAMKLHAAKGDDGVQILTVHQAKGLQAQCVFLADPGQPKSAGRAPSEHTFTENGSSYIALALREPGVFRPKNTYEPPNWAEAVRAEELFARAEHVRLLYVACTRAARQLIVCHRDGGKPGVWDDLIPALRDAPVLAHIQDVPVRVEPSSSRDGADRKRGRILDRMRVAIAAGTEPTHILLRPSDKEETDGVQAGAMGPTGAGVEGTGDAPAEDMIPTRIGMEGKDFGQAVHLGLERMVVDFLGGHDPDPHQIAVASLRAVLEREPSRVSLDAVTDALTGFRSGALWRLVTQADEVLTEVSFTTPLPGSPVRIVSGTVDLALRSGDDWLIVDYKTDALSAAAIASRYQPQLDLYAKCWQEMFPGRTVKTAIWSTASQARIDL